MKTINHPFLISLLITLFALAACAHKETRRPIKPAHGPDTYWNEMTQESIDSRVSILKVIEENQPKLFLQIKKEANDPYLPMFWGESLNFDSGSKKQIIDEKIIEDLQGVFNIKNDNKIVHAGIMHTYGYLFSTIETPYGFKRQRWISPEVNTAFGLKSFALSPETKEGGLFSNITFFAGNIALKNKNELSLLKNVANEIFTFDYAKLKIVRLEESLKDYVLVTSLVTFPFNSPGDNDYLLVYSVISKLANKEFLMTAFPINQNAFEGIVDKKNLGKDQKIQVRYNANISDLEQNLKGTRKIIKD